MSRCLLLFDSDGCTGIEQTSKVDIDARKGGHYRYMYRGKLQLVEVLEISDDEKYLDKFEKAWANSSRAHVLDMRKELSDGKKGDFLSCLPVSQSMQPVIELHREEAQIAKCTKGTRSKAKNKRVKNIGTKISKCVKAIAAKVKAVPNVSRRKYVCAPRGKENQTPDVVLTAVKISSDSCVKRKSRSESSSPVKRIKTTTNKTVCSVRSKPSTRKVPLKTTKTTAARLKHVQPKSRLPMSGSKKKIGTNGRVLNILYEGGMEEGTNDASPKRQPMYTDHLSEDQMQSVQLQVDQFSKGFESVGTQTTPVIVLECNSEVSNFEKNKKWLEILDIVKAIQKSVTNKTVFDASSTSATTATDPPQLSNDPISELLSNSFSTSDFIESPSNVPLLPTAADESMPSVLPSAVDSGCVPPISLQDVAASDCVFPSFTDFLSENANSAVTETRVSDVATTSYMSDCYEPSSSQSLQKLVSPALVPVSSSDGTSLTTAVSGISQYNRTQPYVRPWNAPFQPQPAQFGRMLPISASYSEGTSCSTSMPYKSYPSPLPFVATPTSTACPTQCEPLQPSHLLDRPAPSRRRLPVPASSSEGANFTAPMPDKSHPSPLPFVASTPSTACPTQCEPLQPSHLLDRPAPSRRRLPVPASSSEGANFTVPMPDKSHPSPLPFVASPPSTAWPTQCVQSGSPVQSPLGYGSYDLPWTASHVYVSPSEGQSAVVVQGSHLSSLSREPIQPSYLLNRPAPTGRRLPVPASSSEGVNFTTPMPDKSHPSPIPLFREPLQPSSLLNRPYIEISSPEDVASVHPGLNLKLKRHVTSSLLMKCSQSPSLFGWKLAGTLYSEKEMTGRNFNGRGKPSLSPRRRRLIEESVRENFPQTESIKLAVDAINSGIRNLRRRHLTNLGNLL